MIPNDEILQQMKVWILSDGKIGHVNQSLGVAEELNINPEIIELEEASYSKVLGRINGSWAVKNKFSPPWPDMVIATGTLPALVSGWIKQQSPQTINVQMMKPPCKHYLYDIIASPVHDGMAKNYNIINTIGSPNRITHKVLDEEKSKWNSKFSKMKKPLAVLIGGSNKDFDFNEYNAITFATDTIAFANKHGFKSLLITVSRRTSEKQTKLIQDIFNKSNLDIYFWDGDGNNPYFGYLAWAEAVLVTADSIGMVSESCTAGLPVCVYGMDNMNSKKFAKFFKLLLSQKMIHKFSLKEIEFTAPENHLSDTKMVAGAIHAAVMRNNLVG